MDQKLKDLLDRAEEWPPEARNELVKAAATIEARLVKKKSDTTEFRTLRDVGSTSEPTLLEVLMRAPKTDAVLAAKRGIRVRIRPPAKF
jgi:hypothetical protein